MPLKLQPNFITTTSHLPQTSSSAPSPRNVKGAHRRFPLVALTCSLTRPTATPWRDRSPWHCSMVCPLRLQDLPIPVRTKVCIWKCRKQISREQNAYLDMQVQNTATLPRYKSWPSFEVVRLALCSMHILPRFPHAVTHCHPYVHYYYCVMLNRQLHAN
jgi:hypothetical protein